MVPIADAAGSAPTGHVITFGTPPAGIFCASRYRARPHLTYLATRRFVQVLIVTMGRGVVATSRRYAE